MITDTDIEKVWYEFLDGRFYESPSGGITCYDNVYDRCECCSFNKITPCDLDWENLHKAMPELFI